MAVTEHIHSFSLPSLSPSLFLRLPSRLIRAPMFLPPWDSRRADFMSFPARNKKQEKKHHHHGGTRILSLACLATRTERIPWCGKCRGRKLFFNILFIYILSLFPTCPRHPHSSSGASGRRRSIVRTAGRASMFMGVKSNLWKQMVFVRLLYR